MEPPKASYGPAGSGPATRGHRDLRVRLECDKAQTERGWRGPPGAGPRAQRGRPSPAAILLPSWLCMPQDCANACPRRAPSRGAERAATGTQGPLSRRSAIAPPGSARFPKLKVADRSAMRRRWCAGKDRPQAACVVCCQGIDARRAPSAGARRPWLHTTAAGASTGQDASPAGRACSARKDRLPTARLPAGSDAPGSTRPVGHFPLTHHRQPDRTRGCQGGTFDSPGRGPAGLRLRHREAPPTTVRRCTRRCRERRGKAAAVVVHVKASLTIGA